MQRSRRGKVTTFGYGWVAETAQRLTTAFYRRVAEGSKVRAEEKQLLPPRTREDAEEFIKIPPRPLASSAVNMQLPFPTLSSAHTSAPSFSLR